MIENMTTSNSAGLTTVSTKHRFGQHVTAEIEKGRQLSIIALVNYIIEQAQVLGASDIHIDPTEKDIAVRYRIDGVLEKVHSLPLYVHAEIISRIKILCSLRTDEHQTAQDGRFRVTLTNEKVIDIRVSLIPIYHGENAVLRLLSDESAIFTFTKLGFSSSNIEKILTALKKPYGMILATGPTGSGKTTTLYTLIKMLNVPSTSIITIEDPIEYAIEGINQIQVNSRTGLTFANALRSLLRQDPNIIMVGEIRDAETAGLSVNISLTGHLVFSTLHTNDAATTLPRLLDMKIEPYLIASTVNIAIGQRLVRRLCSECKVKKVPTQSELTSLSNYVTHEIKMLQQTIYSARGCDECNHTGYRGRIGIHEVLVVSPCVREAIMKRATASNIRAVAMTEGMVPLIEDGFSKVLSGVTSIEEVLKICYE